MNKVYLSLGSNRGDRQGNLAKAITLLSDIGGILVQSSLYETEPWKMDDNTPFINQMILIETTLSAEATMGRILKIEAAMGRVRAAAKYEPRTIDIDILFYNSDIITTPTVSVPHPHIAERRFVLEPLAEIAPTYIHPILNRNIKELLLLCKDNNTVKKLVLK